MKCEICDDYRTESRADLATHVLTQHGDYFAERPEAKAAWEEERDWHQMVNHMMGDP